MCFSGCLGALAAARWQCQRAGIVPDHGAGRPENHPALPDCFLLGLGTAKKLASDRGKDADGAARGGNPA